MRFSKRTFKPEVGSRADIERQQPFCDTAPRDERGEGWPHPARAVNCAVTDPIGRCSYRGRRTGRLGARTLRTLAEDARKRAEAALPIRSSL